MAVKFYIKINDGTEFEVFPNKYEPFKKSIESGEMFYRYAWGNIEFENKPFLYNKTSNEAYMIYDILSALNRDDEIVIRSYSPETEIEIKGYLGKIDGSYQNDKVKKVISFNPITLDNYTNLLENYDEKIDVLNGGNNNKIKNGDFETWDVDGFTPTYWTTGNADTAIEKYFINGDYVAKINLSSFFKDTILYQNVSVNQGSNINLTFWYAIMGLTGGSLSKFNASMKLKLTDGITTKYLKSDGKWYDPDNTVVVYYLPDNNSFNYANNLIALLPTELTEFKYFKLFSDPIPFSGTFTVEFNDKGISAIGGPFILLDEVYLAVNTTPYKTINANILDSKLKEYAVFNEVNVLRSSPKIDTYNDSGIEGFFDSTTFEPNSNALSRVDYAPNDNKTGLYLGDYSKDSGIFDDPQNKYYKCQLSEVTIYQTNHTFRNNIFAAKRIAIYGTATFARDEFLKTDIEYTYQDFVDGICDESEVGSFIPPERGVGWVRLVDRNPNGQNTWVRKPFNDENDDLTWELGTVNESSGQSIQGFTVTKSLTSKRVYPIESSKSNQYKTCVELRNIIKILFNGVHPDYANKDVISTFFWNDREYEFESLQGLNSGKNYVNGLSNFLNNIVLLHTYDLKTETSESASKDTEFRISFIDFMNDLKAYFKIYKYGELFWLLTEDNDLRIEHVACFDNYADIYGNVINYTTQIPIEENYHDEFDFETDQMFRKIKFDQINSGYKDFSKNVIQFSNIVSNKRFKKDENVLSNNTKILTTDLKYCTENPNSLDNGFILINYEQVGDNFNVVYAKTQIEGVKMLNGNLSLSSLLINFVRREGTYIYGTINNEQFAFYNTTLTKKGIEITVKGIVFNRFFDTNIDRAGMVQSITHDFENMTTKITLIYRIQSALMAERETDFAGAENIYLNVGF